MRVIENRELGTGMKKILSLSAMTLLALVFFGFNFYAIGDFSRRIANSPSNRPPTLVFLHVENPQRPNVFFAIRDIATEDTLPSHLLNLP